MKQSSEKVPYNVMSDERCACGRQIKENVARRVRRRPLICYPCHQRRKRSQRSERRVLR